MKKICALGLGYIGLPIAPLFASNIYEVLDINVKKRVVETLKTGELLFEEKRFQELLDNTLEKKSFQSVVSRRRSRCFPCSCPYPL